MKTILMVLVCLLLFGNNCMAQTETKEELFGLLQRGMYKELVNKVCSLREKAYYKNAFMDYCLAYGYCQLDEPTLSGEWFDHLLGSYNNLSTTMRDELQTVKRSCTGTQTASHPIDELFGFLQSMNSDGFEGMGAGVESKMGTPGIGDRVEKIDFEHLTFDSNDRQFNLSQKKEALTYYRKLLSNPTIKVDTTQHFLVFYKGHPLAINEHIEQLEEYYWYYHRAFDLPDSNRLITVFYCTNRRDFKEIANRVHNIVVPNSTYGYASSSDLVMLGIANVAWLGAMKHELFHLIIRSFVGDIPPWLDEGTACYFESSSLKNNRATTNLSGTNYRVNLLKKTNRIKNELFYDNQEEFRVPSLKELTNYNWQEFSGKPGDFLIKASYNQSLSYAFVSFLSDKNLLGKTIEAFRNRAFVEPSSDIETDGLTILHLRTNNELLEIVTAKSLLETQKEFEKWLEENKIYLEF